MNKKKSTHHNDELKNQTHEELHTADVTGADDVSADKAETDINVTETAGNTTEEWEQKCVDLNDKNLRLMAEFDNYRKRTLKEKADIIKNAGERIFVDMLPLIDDFERAIQAMNDSEDVNAIKEGIDLIYNKFIAFLLSKGVKAIPTENETFDVDLHEAVTTFPASSEEQKGKIIDCVSKGYILNDKVIRFPKVVVGE